ncbi:MAG: hypothetical protein AAFX79_04485 [Planctomycetota bacterium]
MTPQEHSNTQPDDTLARRKAEILVLAQAASRRRGVRRRGVQVALGSMVVALAAGVVASVLPAAPPTAERTIAEAAGGAPASAVRVVRASTRDGVARQFAAADTARVRRIDDAQAVELLRESGARAGIIRVGNEVRVVGLEVAAAPGGPTSQRGGETPILASAG